MALQLRQRSQTDWNLTPVVGRKDWELQQAESFPLQADSQPQMQSSTQMRSFQIRYC